MPAIAYAIMMVVRLLAPATAPPAHRLRFLTGHPAQLTVNHDP
jgi:hypothetical protein